MLRADLVITGGNILTVNERDEVAQAVAVKGDIIIRVGTVGVIEDLIGQDTEVITLNGETVLPGFIEPHNHFMSYGIRLEWFNARTPPFENIPKLLEGLKKRVERTPEGEWIIGVGIEDSALEEKRFPTRHELDSVVPNNPLYITHRSGHSVVVNTMALTMAGITDDLEQPEGGHRDRDLETGSLTGVLREKAAFKQVQELLPVPTKEQMKRGLENTGKLFATAGITSIHDAGVSDSPEVFRAYQEAVEEGLLKTRVYLMIHDMPYIHYYLKRDLGLRTGFGDHRLRLGSLKTCTDGSIQVFTCAFYDPYITVNDSTEKNPKGVLQMSPNEINGLVLEAHRKGYQVAIHAQGDYGIDVAIDAIQYAMWKYPRKDARHRIEHCQCVSPEGLKRMKRLGIIGSFYPHHTWYWGDRHISTFIGRERAQRQNPMKSSMEAGVVTIAHSDAPIATIGDPLFGAEPLFGIWCAVNRKTRAGELLGKEECISPMEGIRAFTINAAYASFEEKIKGSIEPGKLADFVILEEDPTKVDPWHIRDIKVKRTIIGGETVFQK